jgi:2-dehydropantoate 2-reductase
MPVRVLVCGAGGIGGTVAGYLVRGGHSVVAIDPWHEHVAAMNADGLLVESATGAFRVNLLALLPEEHDRVGEEVQLAVIATKAYDTESAYRWAAPHLAADGTFICAQNGITEGLVGALSPGRVIGCAVTLAAEFAEPGVVKRTSPDGWPAFTIGELDGGGSARVLTVASTLEPVGEVTVSDDVATHLWSKLARNAMTNGLAALTGGATRVLWSDPSYHPFVISAAAETARVAMAAGVTISPIAGRITAKALLGALDGDISQRREVARLLTEFALERTAERDHLPSMLQDAMKGRRTEIDDINGYVVRQGRILGIKTPVNTRIVELVHALERGELAIDPANIDLLQSSLGELADG